MEKTFIKGLRLLECLAGSQSPRGVTELAGELGMTKSNVHRILNTLVHAGYVMRNAETSAYTCTLKLWIVANPIIQRVEVKAASGNFIHELAAHTQETVHLSRIEDNMVLYLDKIESPHPIRAYTEVGGRAPLHCVATGKALLAFQTNSFVNTVLKNLTRHSESTITDAVKMKSEIQKIRKKGFAFNRGEYQRGVGGIAAPIFDASDSACAAVGISGPIERLTLSAMNEMAPAVVDTAAKISKQIGGNWHKSLHSFSAEH